MKVTQEHTKNLPVLVENRFGVKQEIERAWVWSRENPLKAAGLGVIGIIGIRSRLFRSLALMSASSAGTLWIRKKIAKSEILH